MGVWVEFKNLQGHFDHYKYTDDPNCSHGVGGMANDKYSVAIVRNTHHWTVYVPTPGSSMANRIASFDKQIPLEEAQTKAIEMAAIHKLTN